MSASKKAKKVSQQRPRQILGEMARQAGCLLGSIGDIEQLAGINIKSKNERRDLWFKFQHLFKGPTQQLFDAVMDHCSEIALQRIRAGELSLIKTQCY